MIKKFWVRGFRNLSEAALDFSSSKSVLIVGENNQGKSNFLESLYFLGNGDSPLTSTLGHVPCFGSQECVVGGDYSVGDVNLRVYGKLDALGKRRFVMNDTHIPTFVTLRKKINIDYLSADVIRIFKESPEFRRKDLDRFCSVLFSGHKTLVSKYDRLIRQKNRLIKDGGTASQLRVWNPSLAQLASQIVRHRLQALEAMRQGFNEILGDIETGFKEMDIQYHSKGEGVLSLFLSELSATQSIDAVVKIYFEALTRKLEENTEKERRANRCLYGAHRDDFELFIDGKSLFHFYSRGINRMMAVLYKVIQLSILDQENHGFPVLLLDDVFAELDMSNKRKLVTLLEKRAQVFYTTVIPQDAELFESPKVFSMVKGQLVSEKT